MSAAGLLRTTLDDAPAGLRIDRDGNDDLALFDEDDTDVLAFHLDQDIARLVGLLLAAAPHLAAMLNATERPDLTDEQVMVATLDALDKMREAITEAGESL